MNDRNSRQRRTRKLVAPGLQLKLSLWFLCLIGLAMTLQFVFMARSFSAIALGLPGDAAAYYDSFASAALRILSISLGVVLPLTLVVGVLASFRIVGPLKRLEGFLAAVERGERPPDLSFRKGDELQSLCRLANAVTASARGAGTSEPAARSTEARRDVA